MKQAVLAFLVALSLLTPALFAATPAAPHNSAVHKVIGVVKSIASHQMTIETVINGDKEHVDVYFGQYPVGIQAGERVSASYRLVGTSRIALGIEPIR